MAKVKMNPLLEKIKGAFGDIVFKSYGGKTIISRKPDMEGRQSTPAQLAVQEEFRQASLFGKMVYADPVAKAVYTDKAKAKGQPVFSLMVADYFNLPSVDEIDMSAYTGKAGDVIKIEAHDDFEVTKATITISDVNGSLIESGDAVETPPKSGMWNYTATQAVTTGTEVRIGVQVKDRPGHADTKEGQKTV